MASFTDRGGSAYDALSDKLRDDLRALTGYLQSDAIEPILFAMFKDHSEVTVTAASITVDDYSSHD